MDRNTTMNMVSMSVPLNAQNQPVNSKATPYILLVQAFTCLYLYISNRAK